ncbi:MAG: coproporphyrinogen III oxidase family protein [bacterium]|nr:coproporphyrinogen III oxidase family protein [bacterium]
MAPDPTNPDDARESESSRAAATTTGNYFVSNYPPFSVWQQDFAAAAKERLDRPPAPETSLGLYVHIPFCRKRCDFCYFRVYTDKNSDEVRRYTSAVVAEAEAYATQRAIAGRPLDFVYFGGGTPSYLSVDQLTALFGGIQEHLPWHDTAREITFECEPGTLQEKKIKALKDLGITRLSLGVENFDPEILELNNRAHRAKEIDRAYDTARDVGFRQINIDLIAGMVGETDDNWQRCIERTLELQPDSVTIYQMEIPFNTTVARRMKANGEAVAPVADWATKRRWVDEAFAALEGAGYYIGSAYTAARGEATFLYRDGLWHGADLLGLGVASFSHLNGVHFQNEHDFLPYVERVERGELPIHRALPLTDDQRLIREFILQLKLGAIDTSYFETKFGIDVRERFAEPLQQHVGDGFMAIDGRRITVARHGMLQIDRLLHDFFPAEHRAVRYA